MKPHIRKMLIFFMFLLLSVGNNAQLTDSKITSNTEIKRITIASEPDYPPYCIIDNNGNADGFSVDLFKAAAKAVDIEVDIKIGVWNKIKEDLAEGKIDALPLVGRTPEREELFDFTLPYLTLHGAIFVREGTTDINSIEDLKNKSIAVMTGDNAEEFVRRKNLSEHIFTTHTFEEAFISLANGERDAVITQRIMGIELLKKLDIESVVPLDINLNEFKQDFCFAVKKGNTDLLSRLNEGLSIVIANKTYDKLHLEWFGPNIQKQIAIEDVVRIVLYILIPLIIIFSIVSIFFLRSEVKRRTSNLQESEERFRAIFEQAAVGAALLNTVTGEFIRINQKYCDFVGYSMDEMLQKTLMDITYRKDIEPNLYGNKQLMENRIREYSVEKRYIHKNGNIIWGKLTISPLWKPGEIPETYLHIAIVEDITIRKQEELLIQRQNIQLKELNATKDKFFSIIAHDLKSPFLGLLGLTELMSDGSEKFSHAEYIESSKLLNNTSHNLFKLLENLLDWAQVQDGSIIYEPVELDLSEIIIKSIDTQNLRAKQKNISIINENAYTQKILADEKMIETVLRNLLSNAVKFTRKDGKVFIKTKLYDNGTIEISVEDNGLGIAEDDVARLFKIEEKVNSEGTDGELSSGLGLLLCKEFVDIHGGKIWVESELNKGSIFYFTIPVPSNIPAIKENIITA